MKANAVNNLTHLIANIINGDIQKIIDELMLAENTNKLKELGETI